MTKTRVKICCIASLAEARIAIAAGADALGLVAAMPSGPGPIADDLIAEIAAATPPAVSTFLLTSRTTARDIIDHVEHTRPSVVQIVSHIDPAELEQLSGRVSGVRIVQVVHVEGEEALELIPRYQEHVHAFLLDSGKPSADVPEFGGTGRTHDWDVSRAFVEASPVPVFLAGGLNASNVGAAVETVRPFGVDLCSGVRTNGRLDAEKLRQFMDAVKQ